jgi:hypothetical protein
MSIVERPPRSDPYQESAMASGMIEIRDAPAIPGLRFRGFRGKEDFPLMLAALSASTDADEVDQAVRLEDIPDFPLPEGIEIRPELWQIAWDMETDKIA